MVRCSGVRTLRHEGDYGTQRNGWGTEDGPAWSHSRPRYSQTGPYVEPFRRQEAVRDSRQAECMANGPIISSILSEVNHIWVVWRLVNAGKSFHSAPGVPLPACFRPVFAGRAHSHQWGRVKGEARPVVRALPGQRGIPHERRKIIRIITLILL